MKESEVTTTHKIYAEQLDCINGIGFTYREIDIIACLLDSKPPNKIAHFLSINKKTVSHHISRIKDKIGVNAREEIPDFIQKSECLGVIKEKYIPSLLIRTKFEEQLKKISQMIKEAGPFCYESSWQSQKNVRPLVTQLKSHLKMAGISVRERTIKDYKPISEFISERISGWEPPSTNYIFYILPKDLTSLLKESVILEIFILKTLQGLGTLIFLHPRKNLSTSAAVRLNFQPRTLFLEKEKYYLSFLEILKELNPTINPDKINSEFRDKCKKINYLSQDENPIINKTTRLFKNKKRYFCLIFLLMSSLIICFLIFKEKKRKIENKIYVKNKNEIKKPFIRSDLVIPVESSLLHRPALISQINAKLKKQDGIQTIALTGPGGAGKTTLARQYAHQQKASVIWEINAETPVTLKDSFENFAQAFSKTEEDKKRIKEIQVTKNPTEREEKIIQFIKEHLRTLSNWILIFDNIEKFSTIQKHFPHDSVTWGQGKIILTTRDSNIQNNKYIPHVVQIGELNLIQKLDLFNKIIKTEAPHFLTYPQVDEVKRFLEEIPPFPLDVSIAAYYLKATNVSLQDYLENLKQNNKEFVNMQENLLKEAGDYARTRYSIISLSLRNLIHTHTDFRDLLLLISLLDSQNIPIEILSMYKKSIIVDNFIYSLKKYSLITARSSTFLQVIPSFSIHRSTQEISLAYLLKEIGSENMAQLIQAISNVLEKYIVNAIEKKDFLKMRILENHCKSFLKHGYLLDNVIKGAIESELGRIYLYLGYYAKAQQLLEKSLVKLDKNNNKHHFKIAKMLAYLGNIYIEAGDFEKAKDSLEHSLLIYKKYFPENHSIVIQGMKYLGNAYRQLGEYEKAKNILEKSLKFYNDYFPKNYIDIAQNLEYLGNVYRYLKDYEKAKDFLEQSAIIYKNHSSENQIDIALINIYLGNIYKELGNYEKAKDILEKSVLVYKDHFSENHIEVAWASAYLGDIYTRIGEYEKAKNLLEQSVKIHREQFGNDNTRTAWVLNFLGIAYKELGNYEGAKKCFQIILTTYEKSYGKDSIEIAQVLMNLGQVYLLEEKLEIAETFINKALGTLKKNEPFYIYIFLEFLEKLAELYLKISMHSASKGNVRQSTQLKKQAITYLKQALNTAKIHLPAQSSQIINIQFKLKNLEIKMSDR